MGWWSGANQLIKDCNEATKQAQKLHDELLDNLEKFKMNRYSKFLNSIQLHLPSFEILLLNETNNDIVCNWRTFRVCKNGKYLDFHFSTIDDPFSIAKSISFYYR